MIKKTLAILLAGSMAFAANADPRSDFVDTMVNKHNFDRVKMQSWMDQSVHKQKIIDAITRPAEGKAWYQYRKIFLGKKRIDQGVTFYQQNKPMLDAAAKKYGVDPLVITAIIGVETRYGKHAGGYRVIDSLATLGFGYPKRSKFFLSELEQFFLLCREQGFDPLKPMGSYAGAMGKGQFIASSYRNYAVDGDGDKVVDLFDNTADAIFSVAAYFKRHGWKAGEPVATSSEINYKPWPGLVNRKLKPDLVLSELREAGVPDIPKQWSDNMPARLLELKQKDKKEYWTTLHNFYVITRYNHSALYAMAVWQLSREIEKGLG